VIGLGIFVGAIVVFVIAGVWFASNLMEARDRLEAEVKTLRDQQKREQ